MHVIILYIYNTIYIYIYILCSLGTRLFVVHPLALWACKVESLLAKAYSVVYITTLIPSCKHVPDS